MKNTLLIVIFSLMIAVSSSAAVMTESAFGGASDLLVVDYSGVPLSSGYAASGFFSIPDAAVTADLDSGNFAALIAAFIPVVSDDFVKGGITLTNGIPIPGYYATGDSAFDPTPFIGKTIYTFITNGTSLVSAGAYQFALISFSGRLFVTADPVIPPANAYNLYAADGIIVYGQSGPVTHSDPAGGDLKTIQLAVPEPSVALLSFVGVTGLIRRRR